MKKIIATVLAMVMALALCTTAFAAGFIGDDMDKATAAAKDGSTTTVVTKIQDARADSTNSYAPLYLLTSTTKDANGNVTNTTTKNAVEMADAHGADHGGDGCGDVDRAVAHAQDVGSVAKGIGEHVGVHQEDVHHGEERGDARHDLGAHAAASSGDSEVPIQSAGLPVGRHEKFPHSD